jgi:lysophospholipase L1-like esterase
MPRQVLCYGDSSTWGCMPLQGDEAPTRFTRAERWTGVLQDELGADYWIIEEGLNGRTTTRDDVVESCRSGLTLLLPTLEAHHPLDLVVVMLGTNDLKERFAASPADVAHGAGELVKVIRGSALGPDGQSPQVVLVSPRLIGRLRQFSADFDGALEKSRLLGPEFRRVADERRCAFLDAGSLVSGSDADGVHLDRGSHSIIGKAVAIVVRQTLVAPVEDGGDMRNASDVAASPPTERSDRSA